MMWRRAGLRHRQVTPMNVPVHQIMFTPDRDALPPPAAEEIRSRAGGDPYRMWFLDDARALINDVYGLEVLRAFDIIQPFASKADLARYCIVNHIGGIYMDLSVTDFVGFDVGDHEFVGFRDLNSADTSWKVANHMFYSTKDSPILQATISECVANVRRRFYGKDPHFPTGPSVLGRAVANRSFEASILIGDYWWLKRRRNKYTLPGQGVIARGKVGGHHLGGFSGVPGGNNHDLMWRERAFYGPDDSYTHKTGDRTQAADRTR
jgi:Glycosyltransferase sugar-binding region containing DXD motif